MSQKITNVIEKLIIGFCYLSEIEKNLFWFSTILGFLGLFISLYFDKDTILVGIGQSIIATYIFYIFLDCFPKVFSAYENSYQQKSSYDLLRLMLLRIDEMFLYPFEQICVNQKEPKLQEFFSLHFLGSPSECVENKHVK